MQSPSENLGRGFFARSADAVARDLLGCRLTRTLDDGSFLSGIITETEAYTGPEDRASHAFGGRRTPRNEHMWSQPGTAYVYFTYGMHHCFNIACFRDDHPAAVLIRAVVPSEGIETMRAHRTAKPRKHPLKDQSLCDGPGKLCQAMRIDRTLDGIDLLQSPHLAITQGVAVSAARIRRTPRIGIAYAGDWVQKPLRWVTEMDPT
ncbi:MAG: DNA-3-methyladenine glycosylase [Phycisphaerales bacterium JB052]